MALLIFCIISQQCSARDSIKEHGIDNVKGERSINKVDRYLSR
jgi:hypothetical protein